MWKNDSGSATVKNLRITNLDRKNTSWNCGIQSHWLTFFYADTFSSKEEKSNPI